MFTCYYLFHLFLLVFTCFTCFYLFHLFLLVLLVLTRFIIFHYLFCLFVVDDMIEAHLHDPVLGYQLASGYPKLLVDEFSTSSLPYFVNAAAYSQTDDVVYLLQRDDVFQYNITGQLSTGDLTYTFIRQFNMLDN